MIATNSNTLHLREVICNCANETMKIQLNPKRIESLLISNKGIIIRMKAGYSRNLSVSKMRKYFGDN